MAAGPVEVTTRPGDHASRSRTRWRSRRRGPVADRRSREARHRRARRVDVGGGRDGHRRAAVQRHVGRHAGGGRRRRHPAPGPPQRGPRRHQAPPGEQRRHHNQTVDLEGNITAHAGHPHRRR